MNERRKYERTGNIRVRAKLQVKSSDIDENSYPIINVSLGGILINYPGELKANQLVTISFDPADTALDLSSRIKAIVVRCENAEEHYHIALMFVNPTTIEERELSEIIKLHK